MRKVLIAASFVFASVSSLYAQKAEKISDVQEKYEKGKYDEAKEKIDKVLADPKNQNNADAWYWKGNVYTQLAKQDSLSQLSFDAANEALQAYKKYQELDPKDVRMTLDQHVGYFILRDHYANRGDFYWAKKDYAKAFENYQNALKVEEFINSKNYSYNKFSYPALDTTLIRYTAAAAYSAKMEDKAIPYFEKLANAKLKDKEFKDIYGLLVQYYIKKGDQANADKYLAMGKELFPDEDYWLGIEIGDVGNDKDKRMQRLGEMAAKYPDNPALSLDYAIELRNHAFIFDTKPTDYNQRVQSYNAALQKAVTLNPKSELATFLASEYYYILISDLEEDLRAVRGSTAADLAKKKDINAKIDKAYEDMLGTSLKAYDLYAADPNLKIQDKANFRKVINQLVEYYQRKKNTERVTFYQTKLKSL